jgi:hypothetical protein
MLKNKYDCFEQEFGWRLCQFGYATRDAQGLTDTLLLEFGRDVGVINKDIKFIKDQLDPKSDMQWVAIVCAGTHLWNARYHGDDAITWAERRWKRFRATFCRKLELSAIMKWSEKAIYSHPVHFKSLIDEKELRGAFRGYMDEVYGQVLEHVLKT